MPHEVIGVSAPMLSSFLGDFSKDANERAMVDGAYDTGLRAIMFTDIEGSTGVSTIHGDETAVRLVRRHDTIVSNALTLSRLHQPQPGRHRHADFSLTPHANQGTPRRNPGYRATR
jgi:hypothetical protein